ncbi:metallophosphoesterase family protein [Gordonia liuliyuniae]|uniref:Nuclease SbcCD subunit D n=1 Tax=Gordonia liuliyuniae TaxID=2911517 RepID=A0ABS9IXF5_9ACTN|nr:metallophosphoesterase [Gordonia liuliyuniae]MCF8590241.1 metallophosphoesterase [Gordonia liuliyuniae]
MTEPLFEMEPLSLFDVPDAPAAPIAPQPVAPRPAESRPAEPQPLAPEAPPALSTDPEVTFLHTADWQLGMTRRFLTGEAQHTYAAARDAAVVRIGEVAAETGAEFVVVCGDVFDDPRVSTRIIRRTLDALGDYPVPVYLLPGNHDPLDATSVYRSAAFVDACPDNVRVLDQPGVVRVRDGVSIVAAPWHSKHPTSDLIADQLGDLPHSDDIRIVVGHGGMDSLSPNPDPSIVRSAGLDAATADQLVDYVALGDRHSVTSVGESGRVWYSGAPEVTAFDNVETEPGHVLEVTLRRGAASSVDVRRHKVGQWSFHTLTQDMDGASDVERLRVRLDALTDKPRTVVQLALVGTLTVSENVALDRLLEEASDRFAAVKTWDRRHDLTVVSDAADLDRLDLQGYAAQAAEELQERASTGDDDAAAARSALSLLYRLAGSTR